MKLLNQPKAFEPYAAKKPKPCRVLEVRVWGLVMCVLWRPEGLPTVFLKFVITYYSIAQNPSNPILIIKAIYEMQRDPCTTSEPWNP